jgi:hypothetical protein
VAKTWLEKRLEDPVFARTYGREEGVEMVIAWMRATGDEHLRRTADRIEKLEHPKGKQP